MFGLSSWTTSGTVVPCVTSANNAFSCNNPRRRSRWLYSGLPAIAGLFKNAAVSRSASLNNRSTVSRSSASRTARNPSSANARRCSVVSATKSISTILPDHATVLHLIICRRQDLRARKQRAHVIRGVERVVSALLLKRIRSNRVAFKIQVLTVNQNKPRCIPRALTQRRHVDIQCVAFLAFKKDLAFKSPDEVVSRIAT